MLHPDQFRINEAWLAFRLNDAPIQTERDGDFNCIALMDAASGFILANAFAPAGEREPSASAVRKLLADARAHHECLPATLYLPTGQFESVLTAEAERQGIRVVHVAEEQLRVFIDDARQAFREHFDVGRMQ